MGELESEKEREYFITLIDDKDILEIYITFLNAKILLQRYLCSYLHNIGIKCSYVERNLLQSQSGSNISVSEGGELSEEQIIDFLQEIYNRYGYDYRQYQMDSIKRRIKIAMFGQNIRSFKTFRKAVLQDEDVFEQLFLEFSINTTEFFRDPEVFATIKNKILTYLNSYSHIKIWCAGCSTGEEAYSLAILLHESGILGKTRIYATDINPYVIEEAKNGVFSLNTIETDIKNYKIASGERNFIDYFKMKDNYMKVKNEFRKKILFFQHSLVSNGILNEFQLILCRNVLIYLNSNLQAKVLELFYNSLDISGFLVLGKSEGILQNRGYTLFNKYHKKHRIYKKKCHEIG